MCSLLRRRYRLKKLPISQNKILFLQCEHLWREIVKLKAGGKCELTGNTEKCQCHHFHGKSTYALRFDTRNGIYLSQKKHIYGIHAHDPSIAENAKKEIDWYMLCREGADGVTKIKSQKNVLKADLKLIKIALENELKILMEEL